MDSHSSVRVRSAPSASLPYSRTPILPYLFAFLLAACANPVPPTGGPPDQTPPAIVTTIPAADAVNVDARSVRITFSEYVDQGSFAQAFSITPEVEGRPEFSWRGRSVEITFPEPLRENTTYIITLTTDLRDAHGVRLEAPLTLAFSTGPQISRGRLAGRVVEAARGTPVGGIDVYAYAAPDSLPPTPLPERPDYRTQTDPQGAFEFNYLTEQPYYVIALADQNRNRLPDPQERFAAPPRPAIAADTSAGTPLRWITTALDTIPPEPQRVRALSGERLAVRFSEPVRLADRSPEAWVLRDSLRDQLVPVQAVYTLPDAPQEVYLRTAALRAEPHLLRPAAVVDTSGNAAAALPLTFTPTLTADTLRTRFLGFVPDTLEQNEAGAYRLLPRQHPGVRFNQPVDEALLQNTVVVRDTTGAARPFIARTSDGTAYRLLFEPPLAPGQAVEIAVAGAALGTADTVYTRRYERLPERALGARSGVVLLEGDGGTVVVELYPTDRPGAPYRQRLETSNQYLFEGLPEGRYRLRAFLDRDADASWDGGLLAPYRDPEPIVWGSDSLTVRPRWELAAADTLRIPTW